MKISFKIESAEQGIKLELTNNYPTHTGVHILIEKISVALATHKAQYEVPGKVEAEESTE